MRPIRFVFAMFALTLLAACSNDNKTALKSSEPPPQPEKKEPLLYTGRGAFQKMYISAHQWAVDAKPYHLESVLNQESNGHGGKATKASQK